MDPHYLLIVAGYLFGSISAAIIVCKFMGLPDPRTEGSRNPGATNVARLGGKKAAALTLLGDMLKGLLPVVAAHALHASPTVLAGTALAAFLGHLYPVFFRFQGGKGVATALGVTFGLYWPVGLLVSGIWLVMAVLFRYSSLAALTAVLAIPAGSRLAVAGAAPDYRHVCHGRDAVLAPSQQHRQPAQRQGRQDRLRQEIAEA